MSDDPFDRLVFNADGRLVELSDGVVLRTPEPPPSIEWMPVTTAAQTRKVSGMTACITRPDGPLWDARVVSEPFEEGGITYVNCCPEADFWRWYLTPADQRTPRPRARCWPAKNVWIIAQKGVADAGEMPPDPFLD